MKEERVTPALEKMQRILEIGVIVSLIICVATFMAIYIWNAKAPGTVPVGLLYAVVASLGLPYALAAICFVIKIINKIYTKKKEKK